MATSPKKKVSKVGKKVDKKADKKERRSESEDQPIISAKAVEEGSTQIETEITILEGWLKDLKETSEDNPEAILSKTTYTDMLLNRQELLNTLKKH